jgi:hypothetical protein
MTQRSPLVSPGFAGCQGGPANPGHRTGAQPESKRGSLSFLSPRWLRSQFLNFWIVSNIDQRLGTLRRSWFHHRTVVGIHR